jgi:hypothetical protein
MFGQNKSSAHPGSIIREYRQKTVLFILRVVCGLIVGGVAIFATIYLRAQMWSARGGADLFLSGNPMILQFKIMTIIFVFLLFTLPIILWSRLFWSFSTASLADRVGGDLFVEAIIKRTSGAWLASAVAVPLLLPIYIFHGIAIKESGIVAQSSIFEQPHFYAWSDVNRVMIVCGTRPSYVREDFIFYTRDEKKYELGSRTFALSTPNPGYRNFASAVLRHNVRVDKRYVASSCDSADVSVFGSKKE